MTIMRETWRYLWPWLGLGQPLTRSCKQRQPEDNIPTVSKEIWTTGENGVSKQVETSLVTFYSGSLLLIICNSAL